MLNTFRDFRAGFADFLILLAFRIDRQACGRIVLTVYNGLTRDD